VDNSFTVTNQQYFGPYAGWRSSALSAGADGVTRLVWDKVDGSVELTLLNADNTLNTSITYAPWVAGALPDRTVPAAVVAVQPVPVVPAAGTGSGQAAANAALLVPAVESMPVASSAIAKKARLEEVAARHHGAAPHRAHRPRTATPAGAHHHTAHESAAAPRRM
jgi:hypothetical protein